MERRWKQTIIFVPVCCWKSSDQQILVIFSSCLFVPPFLNEFAVRESWRNYQIEWTFAALSYCCICMALLYMPWPGVGGRLIRMWQCYAWEKIVLDNQELQNCRHVQTIWIYFEYYIDLETLQSIQSWTWWMKSLGLGRVVQGRGLNVSILHGAFMGIHT